MKTLLLIPTFIALHFGVSGQITSPLLKANFGVEADLRANFFNNGNTASGDDWFRTSIAGSGIAVIDTNGAAALVANYFSNPVTRKTTFSRLMSVPPYTVSNNKLLLDAVFHRDYHGTDSTIFAGGSNKNGMHPGDWSSTGPGSIPDKNEFLDAMVHLRRDGENTFDSLWMFGAVSLENTNGNRFFDFELYQTDIAFDMNTRRFTGFGPDAGHTSWKFDASGNIIAPGDICFTAEFSSSSLSNVEARIWVHKSALDIIPANFSWGGAFDGAGNGATYGYANILPKTPGDFYTGLQNTASTWAGPFQLIRATDAIATSYIAGQFMEVSINLTKLGIEPGNIYGNYCGTPFRRVLIKSRSSTSFTSELKDFIAPFRMFDYPLEAYSFIHYFCETMPETVLTVSNPNPNFNYRWWTNDGIILGSNLGDSITANAPGTYFVQQQKHLQCLPDETDSITIFFDTKCMVLNLEIRDLEARDLGNKHMLKWTASNNQLASGFAVEFSLDGTHFTHVADIDPRPEGGATHYSFENPFTLSNIPTVYYRIKILSSARAVSYSNLAIIRNDEKGTESAAPVIYPNPGPGEFRIAYYNNGEAYTKFEVFDTYGRKIRKGAVRFQQGMNNSEVPQLSGLADGAYIMVLYLESGAVSLRFIISK